MTLAANIMLVRVISDVRLTRAVLVMAVVFMKKGKKLIAPNTMFEALGRELGVRSEELGIRSSE